MKCWIDGKLVVDTTALSSSMRPAALALKESEWEFSLPDSDRESHVLAIESAAAKGNDLLSLLSFRLFLRKDIGRENAYFAVATPGERNGNPAKGVASVPTAKPGRGVFTTPIDVSLSSSAPGYQLIYITDGSEPTAENGTLYEGPISVPSTKVIRSRNIAAGLLPSEIVSHTYLFPRSQAGQDGAGLPESWGFTPADYDFGTRDPGSPAEDLNVALSAIPSMSVTLPSTDLFGADGLMANPDYRGAASALRASVEWIWPGGQNFQDDGTVRIKGEASRTPDFIKHGLRLDFPDRTGGPLRRPVFAQSSRSRFNTLMLHGSFVDNTITLREKAQFIRDLWVRDTLRSMGWPSPHGDYFHLYLNGLYWGLYHAGERADAQWCSTYLGGTPEEWDVVDDFGTIDGDNSEWLRLLGFLQGAEPNAHNYREVVSQFDIPAFIDYMLANIYAVNTDWPGHNWYAARRKDGGLWRFITWDAEYSFDRVTQNLLPEIDQGLGGGPGDLLSFLAKFPEFRQQFADRVRLHFYDNGMLTPQSAEETWMTRAAQIADAVPAEMKRWGDVSPGFPFEVKFAAGMPPSLFRIGEGASLPVTAEDWRKELDRLHRDWFPHRSKILLRQLRAVGLYPDVTPPAILPKGGFVPAGTAIEIANQGYDAELYYTLDGSDPANADGTRSSSAIRYTGPLTISGPTQIKVRGFYEGEASALTQASFEVGTDPRALKISEIHFAPPGAGQQVRREYVELLNTGDSPLALGGVTLEDAVDFTFPEPFVLSGKGRVVLVRDRAAFAAAWPRTVIAGEYAGALANEGETLVLRHPVLGVLETINFRPYSPWPENSSGSEVSLQRTTFSRSAALASSWAAAPPTPALEVDPALIDTDGDGLPDEWEKDNGTKLASPDALVDYDGDGFDSRQEFLAGTSPVDASDFLQINSTWVATTGNIHVAINVVPRRSYALQFSQDLATPWVEIYPFDSGDQNQEIVVNIGALAKEGFLRLVLDPRSRDIR
ncbi:MAG: CotH kinase family protein [Verrucomicrobia bacterium]|nr:CotH kinase family protein [Verrucomicrobiota bacterium]